MKKIIALAIASAFVAPAVLADAVVYGGLYTGLEFTKTSDSRSSSTGTASTIINKGYSKWRLADQSSRVGFKASDKLDNGWTVSIKSEQRVRVGANKEDGTSTMTAEGWGDREQTITIAGKAGQVRIGKFDDIIDASRGDFYDGLGCVADETCGRSSYFVRRGSGKSNNTIAWESAKGAFNYKAQYVLGKDSEAQGLTRGYAATAWYAAPKFDIGLGRKVMDKTSSKDNGSTTTTNTNGLTYKYTVVGVSIKPVDGLTISLASDKTKVVGTVGAKPTEQLGYGLGGKYKAGKFSYSLNYGILGDSEVNGVKTDNGGKNLNAGIAYSMSKQTTLVAGFSYLNNDTDGVGTHNNGATVTGKGLDFASASVGIKASF